MPACGDFNADRQVNVQDLVLLVQEILGAGQLLPDERPRTDMDASGDLDILDLVMLVETILE